MSRPFRRLICDREINIEGGAVAGFAGGFDPALMLVDDAVNGGQAQAGTFADFLGGEKRLEQVAQRNGIHAASGVDDAEADESPVLRSDLAGMSASAKPVSTARMVNWPPRLMASRELTARLMRICRNISWSARIGGKALGILSLKTICSPSKRPNTSDVVFEGIADIQGFELHDLFAAEGEHLADELGRAFDAAGDLCQGRGRIRGPGGVVQQEAGVALNDGHNVVEFVGEAGGQLADGGEALLAHDDFLAFLKGLLGKFSFGDFLLQAFSPFVKQLEYLVVLPFQSATLPLARPADGAAGGHAQEDEAEQINDGREINEGEGDSLAFPEARQNDRGAETKARGSGAGIGIFFCSSGISIHALKIIRDVCFSTIYQQRLGDGVDAVVIEEFVNVGGGQALAVGDEQHAVFAEDTLREDHAGQQFRQRNDTLFAWHDSFWSGAEEDADGFRIEGGSAAPADHLSRRAWVPGCFPRRRQRRRAAAQPWDIIAGEVVRIAAAIETFVMAANGWANGSEVMDEAASSWPRMGC